MTPREAIALLTKPKSKYRAVPTVVDGVRFASKAEAKRDAELRLLERAGKIEELQRQPVFDLEVNDKLITRYVGDWRYFEVEYLTINGQRLRVKSIDVVEDRKGVRTPAFRLKWKLAQALYPDIEWRLS